MAVILVFGDAVCREDKRMITTAPNKQELKSNR